MQQFITFKKYTFIFIFTLFIFIVYHAFIWFSFSSKIFNTKPLYVGDLARMAYQLDSLHPRTTFTDLPFSHLNKTNWDQKPVDIITIGDSFFNGGALGKNPYLQDHLATSSQKRILNIQAWSLDYSYIDIVNIIINNGWLDQVKPKAIIIETVEREVVNRYERKHDFNLTVPINEIQTKIFERGWAEYIPETTFINTGNYKLPYYNIKYMSNQNAQKNVFKLKLNRPLFSVKADKTLLVYSDDIKRLSNQTKDNIKKVNDNLNLLAEKLSQHNVQLYFLVATDKYDLYYDYLENQQYGPNPFFQLLETMPKKYTLINTKKILLPAVENGVKDIFYADDTHWSYKASELIAKNEIFRNLP